MKTLNVTIPVEIVEAYFANLISWAEAIHVVETQLTNKEHNVHFGDEMEEAILRSLSTLNEDYVSEVDEDTTCKKVKAAHVTRNADGDITLAINPKFITESINMLNPIRDVVSSVSTAVLAYKRNIKRFNAKWR